MLTMQSMLFALAGYLSGGIMYSYIIPRLVFGKDVRAAAEDRNPGAANAGIACGPAVGILCGALDVLKAFCPVFVAGCLGLMEGWSAVPIAIAPVLGHAFSPMLHFSGGKAITTVFGALLGLLPWHPLGIVLALITLGAILLIRNHALAVSTSALIFMLASSLMYRSNAPMRAVAWLMGLVLIYKHFREAHAYIVQLRDERRRAV